MNKAEVKLTCKRQYEEIHERIKDGDIDSVKGLLQDERPGQPLCFEDYSALKRSFLSKQPEISAFLVHFGAKLKDREARYPDIADEDVDLINLLWYFLQKKEKSTLDELTTFSYFVLDNYVISIVTDTGEWFKKVLENKDDYILNLLRLAANRNVYLEDLLQFCEAHFKKEVIKEMLLSCDKNGDTMVHYVIRKNFPKTITKNLIVLKKFLGDDSLFKQLLKSKDQFCMNIFHLAAMRDMYIENIVRFCINSLDREELMKMFLSYDKGGHNVLYRLIMNDSSDVFMRNLDVIKEVLDDVEWYKRFLKTINHDNMNIFHLAVRRKMNLVHLLQLCDTIFEKDDIREMLLSNDKDGKDVIYYVLTVKSSTVLNTLNAIIEIGVKDKWLMELLMNKVTYFWGILSLYVERNEVEGLHQFCDDHLQKEDIKDLLLSCDEGGTNMIHFLCQSSKSETLVERLNVIKEIVGDIDWFKRFLKSTGSDLNNVFHLAVNRGMHLENLVKFYDTHLGKDEIKEMLLSNNKDGKCVINFICMCDSDTAVTNLDAIKEITGDIEWFRKFLKSEGRDLNNLFHSNAYHGNYIENLMIFCTAHLGKDEVEKMLLNNNKVGVNVIDVILTQSWCRLGKYLFVINAFFHNDTQLKQLPECTKSHIIKKIHEVWSYDSHFADLLRFCNKCMGKDEIKELLISTNDDGDNVIHSLILNSYVETSAIVSDKLQVIHEIVGDDKEWFKQILKSKGCSFRNMFHVAAYEDKYLMDLVRFCDAHLEKDEIFEMLLSADESGYNVIHYIVLKNNEGNLEEKLNVIKEVLDDEQMFKQVLQSKGKKSRNIFHLYAKCQYNLGCGMSYCKTHLGMEGVKEMMLCTDDNGDNVLHYFIMNPWLRYLEEDLDYICEVADDKEWFKMLLKSKGKNLRNIFHAFRDKSFLEILLEYCDVHLKKDEIEEMLLSADEFGDNIMHYLINEVNYENLMEILDLMKDMFCDDDFLKHLLSSTGKDSHNIFHLAAKNDMYFHELVKYCGAYLQIGEIKNMVFSANKDGLNALHLLFEENSTESVMKTLNAMKDMLTDDERFRELLESKCILLDHASLSG